MNGAYKIRTAAALILAALLAACVSGPGREAPPSAPPQVPERPAVPHEGRAFGVVTDESLLEVLVYRGGALARAGHNHVIASHGLTGVAYVPEDPTRGSFEVHVPVNDLVVDEAALRAAEGPDFSPDVPDSAKDGTRRNMLSPALLDGARYPQIVLQSEHLQRTPEGMRAQVRVTVRDQVRSFAVPLHYSLHGNELRVRGELALAQTELGLTPLSLLGGALHVVDEIKVKFDVVARAGAGP